MNLEECRKEIDQIDTQLLQLYLRRMQTVIEVARYKKEHGLPVLHPKREQEIIDRQTAQSPEALRPYVRELYQTLMATSRAYQEQLLGEEAK